MDLAFERKSGAVPAAVGGLCAIAAGIGVGRFVYTPILPQMIGALGLSKSQAGLIASANFLGYLLGALLAAMPTLPGSRRGWVLGALLVSVLTPRRWASATQCRCSSCCASSVASRAPSC